MVKLGQEYRDSISGFEGVATSRTEFLYGCVRVGLEAHELKEGKPVDSQWFDEQRLVAIPEKKPVQSPAKTGGPMPAPHRAPDCRRF